MKYNLVYRAGVMKSLLSSWKPTSWGELLHPQPKAGAGVLQEGSNTGSLRCPGISAVMMASIYNIEDVESIYVTYFKHLTAAVIKPPYHCTAQEQLC